MKENVNICLIQDAPVFFDRRRTINKMIDHISSAHDQGVDLIVFPEAYVPGYPRGFTFGTDIGRRTKEGKALYEKYWQESLDLQSEDMHLLIQASRKYDMYLVAGITERESTHGSLYCTTVYISPRDGLMGIHRKIKPTAAERIVWSEGDGSTLTTFNTELGILGGLICWENYMPEARLSMYKKGVQLYIAPTADARDSWVSSMQHIALEGRCFVLSCNQYVKKTDIPDEYHQHLYSYSDIVCRGGSLICSPDGNLIKGPVYDQSSMIMATLNMNQLISSKLDFDPNGHYTRNDIFAFSVKNMPPTFNENGPSET